MNLFSQNQRTPEAQAEELLSFLPKKDCFNALCEALIADDQEDIVEKYLKIPSVKVSQCRENVSNACVDTQSNLASSSYHQAERPLLDVGDRETPDCAPSPKKRPNVQPRDPNTSLPPSSCSPPPTIIRIKDSDEKNIYIKYNNPQSPTKRPRTMIVDANNSNSVLIPYNGDKITRYALKHYISEPDIIDSAGADLGHGQILAHSHPQLRVLSNPQSILENTNISDPSRYAAAFARQSAEKPYEDIDGVPLQQSPLPSMYPKTVSSSPSKVKVKDHITIDSNNVNPSISIQSAFQSISQKPTEISSPSKKSQYFASNVFYR